MNTKVTIEKLTEWVNYLKTAAAKDEAFSISWFKGTENEPFSIVGGWMNGFSKDYSDLLCISKSNPTYAMCVKIAVNEGHYAYTDFEAMYMPIDNNGDVDNTCIAIEEADDPEALAFFLLCEWERITREYKE